MLNLSKISSKVSVSNKTNYYDKKTAQNFILKALKASKNNTLTYDQVNSLMMNYTIENQRENHFSTEAKYTTFENDLNDVNDGKIEVNKFMQKYIDFIGSMNKKTNDLIFNTKHKRSFVNNAKYNEIVKVLFDKIELIK